jgi:hypothetical protein
MTYQHISMHAASVFGMINKPQETPIQELLNEILRISKTDKNLLNKLYKIFTRFPSNFRTYNNFNLLSNNQNMTAVAYTMSLIPQESMTQANFDLIINNAAAISDFLLHAHNTRAEMHAILDTLPRHAYTQDVFNAIIAITRSSEATRFDAVTQLQTIVTQRLQVPGRPVDAGRVVLNAAQSTHTASVHKSVSESAIRLNNRYGNLIDTGKKLDGVISIFTQFMNKVNRKSLNKHEGDPKDAPEPISQLMLDSAKKAIKWLSDPTTAFVDKESQVSTRQLLSFIWLGISDDASRLGNLQDAYRKVITALYDIQRGYNLDEHFKETDTRSADQTICTAGTFNKLMEILWGIHKDVELKYITSEYATLKLQKMVPDVAKFYLNDLVSTDSNKERVAALNKMLSPVARDFYLENIDRNTDKDNAPTIISNVAKKDIDAIWQTIKSVIAEQMFDEYGSLYKRGKQDPNFVAFVENGKHINLDRAFIKKLLANIHVDEEKHETKEEYKSDKIISRTSSRRSSSFFLQPNNRPSSQEEKNQTDLKSLSDWQNTFKQTLQEKIISVENNDDKTLHTKLKIVNNLLEKYPLNGIASVAIFERNLSNTVKSIQEIGQNPNDLSSHYSDCLNALQKSLEGITSIKDDMEKNDPDATESDDNDQKLTR